ncbi:MAG: DMT family transporter [Eubacterium sp.]|nr:DMT family transporter [Eubacterium sp.]
MENKSKLSKLYICIPLALFCCFLWGSAFPSIKVGYKLFDIAAEDSYSQILFAGIRFFLAGIMVIIVGSIMQKRVLYPKNKAEIGKTVTLSLFQTILQYTLFYIGLAHTSGVKSSILIAVNVFFSIMVSTLIFRIERLTIQKSIGAVLGFAGIVVINLTADGFGGGFAFNGEGFMLLSSLAYSVSGVLIKRYSEKSDTVMLSGWQFLFGGAFMMLFGFAAGGSITQTSGAKGILMIMYLAFISAAAYTIWGLLLKYNSVSKISVIGLMNPVFGVILSAVFLGEAAEAFSLKNLLALFFVCIGIIVVNAKFSLQKRKS